VLGVGIDHVRRHVIIQEVKEDHVIRHVTCLEASEDYTSRHDLESSKMQHMTLKMFRDERRIATKSTIAKRFFLREAACIQGSNNSPYCTNRTSLENSFYAKRYGIYTYGMEATGIWWKAMEGQRR